MVKKIEQMFGNKSLLKVLLFFIRNPSAKISQTELKNKARLTRTTLIWCARSLVSNRLVVEQKIGTTKLYSLNTKNTIVKQLKRLDTLLQLDVEKIKERIEGEIYLYGSAARGEDVEKSDIDLIIIGNAKKVQLIEEIETISGKIGKNVKIQIFSYSEWSAFARKDPAFYERVEKDKVLL